MRMKVYLAEYGRCVYDSLQELVDYKLNDGYGYLYLDDVVQYNVQYRDCLRENGIEGVINMMIKECPRLRKEEKVLQHLREWWKERMHEHLADYDIQCYRRDERIKIAGSWFNGLDDVFSYVEILGRSREPFFEFQQINRWTLRDYHKQNVDGVHVAHLWESYPQFDSSDAGDDRNFENYFFSRTPISIEMMEHYCKLKSESNDCKVHEHIPKEMLPILYCDGDHPYVLLASEKSTSIWQKLKNLAVHK